MEKVKNLGIQKSLLLLWTHLSTVPQDNFLYVKGKHSARYNLRFLKTVWYAYMLIWNMLENMKQEIFTVILEINLF